MLNNKFIYLRGLAFSNLAGKLFAEDLLPFYFLFIKLFKNKILTGE
jgi:hypothetical protein